MTELTEKSAIDKAPKEVPSKPKMSAEEFLEKYQKTALIVFGGLVLLAGAFAFYKYNQADKNAEAQAAMYKAIFLFEKDSFDVALKGDNKEVIGFQEISEEYSSTQAGKLASFYAGVIYLKQGKFADAVESLEKYDSNDGLYQARSWSLIGDAYSELNEVENSIKYYKKASEFKANEQITPGYLMKLGLAYELNNDWKGAEEAYDKIINDYPRAQESGDAKKYKAKAKAKSLTASE